MGDRIPARRSPAGADGRTLPARLFQDCRSTAFLGLVNWDSWKKIALPLVSICSNAVASHCLNRLEQGALAV
jgi:hypothetical protein